MLNPYDIEQATLNSWGHQIASATVDATGSYVTLDATGSDPDHPGIIDPYLNLLPYNGAPYTYGARYLAIKYRTNGDSTGGNVFVGSRNGPTGAGDMIQFEYIEDGKWHLLVLDLATADAVDDTFNIGYLRYDIYHNILDTMDIGYFALFRSEEAALAYDAEHPYVNSYSVDMNRPENQDFYKESWPDAGIEDDLCVLAYNQAIYCGNIDLSQWSYAEIEYTSDASDITKEAYEKSSSLAIGFKDQASSYGWANDVNFDGDLAHSEMVFSENGWGAGIRCAQIDLGSVTYTGDVWMALHSPEGTIIAITSITFYE